MKTGWITVAVMAIITAAPVEAQTGPTDFNGIWGKYTYSYPKPYMKGRTIADVFNNALLQPWVVQSLMTVDLVAANGRALATAHSLCYGGPCCRPARVRWLGSLSPEPLG